MPVKTQIENTITVTATLGGKDVFETPRAVNLISKDEYERINTLTALDALRSEIGLWTEMKTGTTSDPVMRGLSGSNIPALVDGNTLTTLWGEGGLATDDLYGKIDSEWIERIEVLRGPSSVLYGFSYNYAQDTTNKEPFRHGAPIRGIIALRWNSELSGRPWVEIGSDIVGEWDRIPKDRMDNDPGYRVNPQDMSSPLVRSYGLPGYSEFNVKGGVSLGEHFDLTLALYNFSDKQFRRAHSRMDDPGRNFRTTLAFKY